MSVHNEAHFGSDENLRSRHAGVYNQGDPIR